MSPLIAGSWRIVAMDLWDLEAIDLVGPASIEFGADGLGRFRFIAVEGRLDWRYAEHGASPMLEFTWEGNDEGDRVSGRGWAQLEDDGSLRGRIFFHAGDDSGFRAVSQGRVPDVARDADDLGGPGSLRRL